MEKECVREAGRMKFRYEKRSDEDHGLGGWNLEPAPAAHVLAHQYIVDADHVITGFLVLDAVAFVHSRRGVLLLGPLEPADLIVVPFAAK